MGSVDRLEHRTFKLNFTGDGADKLRESVKDKLKEFMGDYTDDTLVEYVIVLLRNGRRKEEARNELDVFLRDDSDSFVSWLWDHLASNLDLYVQPQETCTSDVVKTKPALGELADKNEFHHIDSGSGEGKCDNFCRSRRKREWKGLMRDATELPLRSSDVNSTHLDERSCHKASHARRSPSPHPPQQKKKSRQDERQQMKREAVSQATIDAPRRLLQFAVRDAVGNLRSSQVKEPSLKRLRSAVSTSTGESSLVDHPRRIQSITRVPNPMATVIKAVQEAAEDAVKVKSREMDVSDTAEQFRDIRDAAVEVEECEEFNQIPEQMHSIYHQRCGGNIGIMETEVGLAGVSMSDNEGYDDDDDMGRRVMDVSETGTSGGNKRDDSLMVQYSVTKNAYDVMQIARNKGQEQPVSSAKTSLNISVNRNTWKAPHYQESREVTEIGNWKSVRENEVDARKSGMLGMKENSDVKQAQPVDDTQKEFLKTLQSVPGSYTTGRPLEDADSRTIFVSNVHFAATKDSLSWHFNKFGEVLKAVIVTDAATGQPKGSAYVEFMRKEAADNALSLDGTSFMSRILKVVKRSPAHQEATPIMTWPRVVHGSPYATARFTRVPFPRGIPGAFRPRLPTKPGARSFQWKRDAKGIPAERGALVSGSTLVSPTGRSLTYVRTEPKT
ncbi:hypothetical protein P3X46_013108 [Hevea brasiliensis]|uniref:RRM domain-containing protein n=1 Tax=Hevea brasiliensis TaxID=3981 RepID=A0ABQ9M4V7_HEVBR|nr:uncharacterized protein LOC110648478 [Hevea brasiliensis]KAJ9174470.1 hypothetical protein P3X46_013108 [Hevea brasiliensis]